MFVVDGGGGGGSDGGSDGRGKCVFVCQLCRKIVVSQLLHDGLVGVVCGAFVWRAEGFKELAVCAREQRVCM